MKACRVLLFVCGVLSAALPARAVEPVLELSASSTNLIVTETVAFTLHVFAIFVF